MRKFLAVLAMMSAASGAAMAQSSAQPSTGAPTMPSIEVGAPDPFAWLEDIHGERALAWVKTENARSAQRLEGDPRYETFRREELAILTAKDRIPEPGFLGETIDNLWQDGAHVKGLWRRTTPASYASSDPQWETLIDLDALSKAEGKNWIWKGAACLPPQERLCLVHLSNGGGDAVEIREFDTVAKAFVPGGFHFAVGKQNAAWLDADTLLISRDWGPGTLSKSGYALVLKQIKRGQTLDQAVEIYRGEATDVGVSPRVLRDADGRVTAVLIAREVRTFQTELLQLGADGKITPLDLPRKVDLHGNIGEQIILGVNEDWAANAHHPAFKAGSMVAYDLKTGGAELIFQPTATQTIDAARVTKDRVLVQLLDNVSGALEVFAPTQDGWTRTRLDLPKGSALTIRAADRGSDRAYVASESFLEPAALWAVDAATGEVTKIKSAPPRFDASHDVVEQLFAISTDGTRIPYFLVRPKAMKLDGTTPVQMFGYGGFQISETPTYRPELGKLWLERGGAYVLTNIRGGGEFGPAWHEAALREHRQRAFDDFAAVAKDLIAQDHLAAPSGHLWPLQWRGADQRLHHPASGTVQRRGDREPADRHAALQPPVGGGVLGGGIRRPGRAGGPRLHRQIFRLHAAEAGGEISRALYHHQHRGRPGAPRPPAQVRRGAAGPGRSLPLL
jgi:prolyl oligopeptidase